MAGNLRYLMEKGNPQRLNGLIQPDAIEELARLSLPGLIWILSGMVDDFQNCASHDVRECLANF